MTRALALATTVMLSFAGSAAALAAQEEGDGGPDILELSLITVGAIFGAAAIGFLLHLFRLRIGFWLHRPPPANPEQREEHH